MDYEKSPGSHTENWRVGLFIVVIFLITGLVINRLFNLTFIRHEDLVKTARFQYYKPPALISGRGNIYLSDSSSNSRKLAVTNKSSTFVFLNSKEFKNAPDLLSKLATVLDVPEDKVFAEISDNSKSYQILKNDISQDQASKVTSLNIRGVGTSSQVDRFYNFGELLSGVFGFVGFDGNQRAGQYGLEAYYDDILSGTQKTQKPLGNKTYSVVSNIFKYLLGQSNVDLEDSSIVVPQDGSDLVLTIDKNIQSIVEAKLGETLKKWQSLSGSIIVEEPNSGAILAMASYPNFNPNNYSDYKLENFINPNIQEVYEPGSSFKPITMAAGLDSGTITPETTYIDTGEIKIGGFTIRNFDEKAHGIATMRQVLEKSLNTGAAFVQGKTSDDTFLNYVVDFGFGKKAEIDLSGEVTGNISNLYSGRKVNFSTASFGQGIAVTPLQLINAYSAIANGGKLMKPYVVKEIVSPNGYKIETKPQIIGSPIKEKTSSDLRSMLVDVVDKGFDKARIKGYDIAGKTGTAQIPFEGGYLSDNQFVHNFVGFAPAYNPKFVVLIKMDKPKGIKFAADSLSPVFGDIARFLIRYFNIPPTR